MKEKRKIAIFTGNRAEYGLQYPIIKAVSEHPSLDYFLLVSGAHLQENFGETKREIEKDGFSIYREIKLRMDHDSLFATAQAIGSGILGLCPVLEELVPDLLVVYADRFEGFSAMIAGTQMKVPTAHVEGGDLTQGGALDDSVRHAMTKLAHLHFTTNDEARERVLRLGEEPWRVFNVGSPALDMIAQGSFAQPEDVAQRYGLSLDKPVVIFTQHSVTTEFEQAADQVKASLEAMKALAVKGYQVIITYPNNDAGGQRIIAEIDEVKSQDLRNIQVHKSLGRYYYHGTLHICGRTGRGVCVGNSSSGIKETAAFGCPVVNIGSRQSGRLRADNVIDTGYDADEIVNATVKCIEDDDFRQHCSRVKNPYGAGNAGSKIAEVLAAIELGPKLIQKQMTY